MHVGFFERLGVWTICSSCCASQSSAASSSTAQRLPRPRTDDTQGDAAARPPKIQGIHCSIQSGEEDGRMMMPRIRHHRDIIQRIMNLLTCSHGNKLSPRERLWRAAAWSLYCNRKDTKLPRRFQKPTPPMPAKAMTAATALLEQVRTNQVDTLSGADGIDESEWAE
jgi:hypothetical protein